MELDVKLAGTLGPGTGEHTAGKNGLGITGFGIGRSGTGTGKTGKERIRRELADRGRTSMMEEIRKEVREEPGKELKESSEIGIEAREQASIPAAGDKASDKPKAAATGTDMQKVSGIKTDRPAAAGTAGDVHPADMLQNIQKEPENAETVIRDGSEEELRALKAWLFKENIRMENLRREMEEEKERLARDRKQFAEESRAKEGSIEQDRKRLEQENRFFDQKMKILQGGFEQLEADRRQFRKEKDKFNACREVYGEKQDVFKRYEVTEMLFRGVNSFLALKKRYKDLIKMFHPDNVAGDHEMVQLINKEYEELKKAYEVGKQA